MINVMEKRSGALAVDGPRGPVFQTKPGVLLLSRKLNYPIVPVTYGTNQSWLLKKTWDQFLIPKPFANCIVAMGKPIWTATQKNKFKTQDLDQILTRWTAEIDKRVEKT